MITITAPLLVDAVCAYATSELYRLLTALTDEPVSLAPIDHGRVVISLDIDPALATQEVYIQASAAQVVLRGGSPTALLHAVYTFMERLGCVFEISGALLPEQRACLEIPEVLYRHTPSVSQRGIRMHLNFSQDQSYFTEDAFIAFIDQMATQRWNYLLFHMYTQHQWFPFTYRGITHLDLTLGNITHRPLPPDMIGREKVHVTERWFPREFTGITDPAALLDTVYRRYQRMMKHAHTRGIRNCVSIEPESLPPALAEKLPEWTGKAVESRHAESDLSNNWQECWSGIKLVEADVRHPLMIDIGVERCLQCIDAFPDLDELQLISREGVNWRPDAGESYDAEIARLCEKFHLAPALFDRAALAQQAQPNDGPEMNSKAHPYWTVLPGNDYYATVMGSIRFIEYALAILADPRTQQQLAERGVASSIAVYSPNPETIRLMMPAIAAMLPPGTRFHCLADYSARDIAANLPAWQPLADAGHQIGVISWWEFDGSMTLAQGWGESIARNVQRAVALGAETMTFNHWRLRGLEHNAAAAAAYCWDATPAFADFTQDYYARLFGTAAVAPAIAAYHALETATIYAKNNNYNIGFTADWVFNNSTDVPGYYWRRLLHSQQNFDRAHAAFAALTECATTDAGKRQAQYLSDLCRISALHIAAVAHLQNAKLPLIGYKAWPLGNAHAAWPPPEKLADLVQEAEHALALEHEYMRIYARWVSSCDEQGQLCVHQQGVIEPFTQFAMELARQLEREQAALAPCPATPSMECSCC